MLALLAKIRCRLHQHLHSQCKFHPWRLIGLISDLQDARHPKNAQQTPPGQQKCFQCFKLVHVFHRFSKEAILIFHTLLVKKGHWEMAIIKIHRSSVDMFNQGTGSTSPPPNGVSNILLERVVKKILFRY